ALLRRRRRIIGIRSGVVVFHWPTSVPAVGLFGSGAAGMRKTEGGSALEVDDFAEELVGGGDHARVRLEATLRHDEVRELGGEVDVRHLERSGREQATAA